jgi:hypothetical protein
MSTAVNGNEFHIYFGVVAPEYLLDVNSVGHLGLVRFRRAGDVVEVREVLTRLLRRPVWVLKTPCTCEYNDLTTGSIGRDSIRFSSSSRADTC